MQTQRCLMVRALLASTLDYRHCTQDASLLTSLNTYHFCQAGASWNSDHAMALGDAEMVRFKYYACNDLQSDGYYTT